MSYPFFKIITQKILLTGPPRCGKSTLIRKIIQRIRKPMTGFFTSEIREKGQRVGFSIETLNGEKGILAHINNKGTVKAGRYGVNIKDINRIAVPSMMSSMSDEIVVIDEIGKMECLSQLFKKTLLDVLGSDRPVIGSIALKGDPFIQKIRKRNDVELIQVSEKNRDTLTDLFLLY